MTEQFGAIPVRAFEDARLSAGDFRAMGAIAYFDRFGRNGVGCYVDPRKLADLAAIDYKHVARHTRRLQEFGYLEINRSATDRRRRVYSLIYNEDRAVVANSGDNLARDDASGDTVFPLDEKVTTSGDNPAEKVTNANSQVVDPVAESLPKRSCKTDLRDPAKPRDTRAATGEEMSHAVTLKTNYVRQVDLGGGESEPQGNLKWGPYGLKGRNQPQRNQPREPDWNGWAKWLESDQRMERGAGVLWIDRTLQRMKDERGMSYTKACGILDRELKRRRKATA